MPPRSPERSRPTSTAQLHAHDLTVERGGQLVLDAVTLTIAPGDRVGLVGPNGAGKSTLLAALAGELEPTTGSVARVPTDATVGLLRQELRSVDELTVADVVARRTGVGWASAALDAATAALADSGGDGVDTHAAALDRWLRLGGADLDARLQTALDTVGFVPLGDPGRAALAVDRLSGGQRARVGLAALLASRFDLLLLDEPTNDLDRVGLDLLEEFVTSVGVPLVVVSHDRRFLERVVTAVVEVDPHTHAVTRTNEGYQGYLRAREIARTEAERRYAGYVDQRRDLAERARTQRQWATKGVRGEKRNPADNDKAQRGFRLDRTEKLAAKARQTERALERLDEVDKPWEPWELRMEIGAAERAGDLVAELVEATVTRGDRTLGPFTVTVGAGERVHVVGPNGAGKTTLLAALLGELPLASGRQRIGPSVAMGRLDQARLPGPDRFLADFQAQTGLPPSEARSLLAKFGLGADHLDRPPRAWSPGERTRATLALFAGTGINTLVLDEPTNHLDVPAIEQLESALAGFAGTVLVVSHDRAFVDNLTLTRRIEVGDGRIVDDRPI